MANDEMKRINSVTLQTKVRRSQFKTSLTPATEQLRPLRSRKVPAPDPCHALFQHLHNHKPIQTINKYEFERMHLQKSSIKAPLLNSTTTTALPKDLLEEASRRPSTRVALHVHTWREASNTSTPVNRALSTPLLQPLAPNSIQTSSIRLLLLHFNYTKIRSPCETLT